MQVQEAISAAKIKQKIGQRDTVLVDELQRNAQGEVIAVGRTAASAPEIDGVVYLRDAEGLQQGDLVEVQIVASQGHDLWAQPPEALA
jgi:ribosomal protein S12 methylthiotransferase